MDHDHQLGDENNNNNNNKNNHVEKGTGSGSGGAPAVTTPRWNPTKEQINMLESLYRQGIRTPSAEQIQQITTRLRAFGHIEGKNVFYWFQNHKARQRQKQKQDNMAYINRFLHRTSSTQPILVPSHQYSCPNVVCSPRYLPVQQTSHSKLPLPASGVINRRISPRLDKFEKSRTIFSCAAGAGYEPVPQVGHSTSTIGGCAVFDQAAAGGGHDKLGQETLELFPERPTGILQGKEEYPRVCSANYYTNNNINDEINLMTSTTRSTTSTTGTLSSSEVEEGCSSTGHDHHHQPFFDFFAK